MLCVALRNIGGPCPSVSDTVDELESFLLPPIHELGKLHPQEAR